MTLDLTVRDSATGDVLWAILQKAPSSLIPPVTYGVVPGTATHSDGPTPTPALVIGHHYRLDVDLWLGGWDYAFLFTYFTP